MSSIPPISPKSPFQDYNSPLYSAENNLDDNISVEDRAKLVFNMMDRRNTGYISLHDLTTVLFERLTVKEKLPSDYNPHDDPYIKQMFDLLDTDNAGKINYNEFYHSYTFFEYFRAGYKKGYEMGLYASTKNSRGSNLENYSDLEFHEFWRLLLHDKQLQMKLESFKSTWNNVLRPGLLKTPIHKKEKLSAFEDFIAGSFAGIITTVVGHPFDTVKVRMQTTNKIDPKLLLTNTAFMQRSEIWRNISKGSLYKGIASPLLSIPLVNAVVFAFYEQSKKLFTTEANTPLTQTQLALCGGFAGFFACGIVSPVELIRTKLQVQVGPDAFKYKNTLDCVRHTVVNHGFKGLGRGMFSTILRDVPSYFAQFYVYEGLKMAFTPEGKSVNDLSTKALLLAGGLGGVAAWTVTFPVDVVKSRLQTAPFGVYTPHKFIPDGGFIDCWKRTSAEQGSLALWKGLIPCLARAFPVNACAFFAYEFSSKWMKANQDKMSFLN